MIKILDFLVRKPGITREEFRAHYESSHVPLALKTFPQIREHRRNYAWEATPVSAGIVPVPWDCVTEIWVTDRAAWDELVAFMSDPERNGEVLADGEKFLDIPKCATLIVQEAITTRGD